MTSEVARKGLKAIAFIYNSVIGVDCFFTLVSFTLVYVSFVNFTLVLFFFVF